MVIRGEPDPSSATVDEWVAYRDHLKSLPTQDETIRLAMAVAQAQIQKLQHPKDSAAQKSASR